MTDINSIIEMITNNVRPTGSIQTDYLRGYDNACAHIIEQLRKMSDWWPIETAPKDGEIILLAGEFDCENDWRIKMGYYQDHEWHLFGASWNPTKWQHLPKPPNSKEL